MVRGWRTSRNTQVFLFVALFVTPVLLAVSRQSVAFQGGARQTKIIGRERLVSVEQLPQLEGPLCPEDAGSDLMASLQPALPLISSMPKQQGAAGSVNAIPPARQSEALKAEIAKRRPTSTVRDPRNVFSGIFIDTFRNEVVMSEENNFSVLVYDRTENTPPRAALSEPKRMIGGEQTYLEYGCGVYVDPATGEIYIINNDTLTWMPVFDRNAKGNVSPNRKLATPYSTFAIVGDEENQELLMTIQEDNAVVTFKKTAKGQDPPVRLLQGPSTQMADPHGLALDTKTGLIFVTNWGINYERRIGEANGRGRDNRKPNWPSQNGRDINGSGKVQLPSITVYRKDDKGDVAPIRTIQGPKTLLDWPTSIALHPDRNEIFVANDTGDSITVYREDANGDAAPVRVIKGPKSLVKNPTAVAVDVKNKELWVANLGNHSATVFPIDAAGDPTPKRVIRSGPIDAGAPKLTNPHTIAYDTKREEILVSN
jgi:DNA-binding beta-propeller fold protein YncE